MKVILKKSTYDVFELKTNEFKALTESLYYKAGLPERFGNVTDEDIRNYERNFIEWRDLLNDDEFSADVAHLREVGAYDSSHSIYKVNKSISKLMDEVVNPVDPYIQAQEEAEHQHQLSRARERAFVRERERRARDVSDSLPTNRTRSVRSQSRSRIQI
jgi:hypothetical protein